MAPSPKSLESTQPEDSSRSYSATFRYLFFLTLLCIVVLSQLNVEAAHSITSPITSLTTHSREVPLHSVRSAEDSVRWLQQHFAPLLSAASSHCLGNYNQFLTPIRLMQKRVKLVENHSETFAEFYPLRWKVPYVSLFESSGDEDRSPYGYFLEYQYSDSAGAMGEGGFCLSLNPMDPESVLRDVDYICNSGFFDRQSATLYIDFALYNGHLDTVTYITVQFQGDQSGSATVELSIQPMRAEPYAETSDYMRGVGEVLYVVVTVLFTGFEAFHFKVLFAARSLQLRKTSAKSKWARSFLAAGRDYFADTWKYVDVACIAISYGSIALWIDIVTTSLPPEDAGSWTLLNAAMDKSQIVRIYYRVNAVNFFLAFLHLIKYLEVFKRIALLRESLQRAWGEIAYFGALVTAVILSFVISGQIALGTVQEEFSTFPKAMMECILIVFRDFSGVKAAWTKEPMWTALFFISYTVLVTMIFMNMFVAILSASYKNSLDDLERRKRKTQKEHAYVRLKKKVRKWWKKLKFLVSARHLVKTQKSPVAEKHMGTFGAPGEVTEVSGIPQHTECALMPSDYNANYLRDKQSSDLQELDSARQQQLKLSSARKHQAKEALKALCYLAFIGLMIGTLIWQLRVDVSHSLIAGVRKDLKDAVKELTFEEVADFRGVEKWLVASNRALDNNTATDYYLNWKLLLVGVEDNTAIRMTLRRLEMTDNQSSFRQFAPTVRKGTGFDPWSPGDQEDKSPLDLGQKRLTYSAEKGYANAGGLVLFSSPSNFTSDMQTIVTAFQGSLNSLVVDYVLYAGNVDYYVHVAHVFRFFSGGRVWKRVCVTPVRLSPYHSPSDKARGAFEVLTVIALVSMAFNALWQLKARWSAYSAWQKELYAVLTPALIKRRNRIKPELFRRLKAVLGPLVAMELVGYCLSLAAAGMWAVLVSLTPDVVSTPLDSLPTYESVYDCYTAVASVSCLLLSLKLVDYFRLNAGLGVLQRTISRASRDILYYLVMFGTFWTAFAFMAHLAFGVQLEHYATLSNSFLYCFQMMTRNYDYKELRETDDVLAPLFFVCFMVFFVCVILNIFISILERAYISVVEKSERRITDRVSLWKSLLSRCWKRPRTRASDPSSPELVITPDLAFKLHELSLTPAPDPESWASATATQILAEHSDRCKLATELALIGKSKEQRMGVSTAQSHSQLTNRRQYWRYLRGAYLLVTAQTRAVAGATRDAVDCEERRQEELQKAQKTNAKMIKHIGRLETDLQDVFNKLPVVEEELRQVMDEMPKSEDGD